MRRPSMNDPEREDSAYFAHYGEQIIPSGNMGIALLERAAHAARELGPLPPRVDAAIGQLGLIAVRIMSRPPSDSAQDLVMLAGMLRE